MRRACVSDRYHLSKYNFKQYYHVTFFGEYAVIPDTIVGIPRDVIYRITLLTSAHENKTFGDGTQCDQLVLTREAIQV